MSSTYYLLCLSHDPALLCGEYPSAIEAESAIAAGVAEHTRCDVAIGRFSGALVEVGCPASRYQPAKLGCRHGDTAMADADWLRLLASAYQSTDEAVVAAVRKSRFFCWPWDRLRRLDEELGFEIRG